MAVTVEAPADLPRLPAAVEVAAYRIATEAVTKLGPAQRHRPRLGLHRTRRRLPDRHRPRPRPHDRGLDPRRRNIVHAGNGPPKSAAPSRSPATRRDPRYAQSCPSADPGRPSGRWTSANGSSAGIMITSDAMPKDPSARAWHPQDMETGGRPVCGVCAAVGVHYLSTGGARAAAVLAADAAFAHVLAERTLSLGRAIPRRSRSGRGRSRAAGRRCPLQLVIEVETQVTVAPALASGQRSRQRPT